MPPFETMDRHQSAVVWPYAGKSAINEPLVGTPVELLVRWVPRQSEQLQPNGTKITVDASAVVDRDIAIDSIMYLGSLSDWQGTGSDSVPTGLMQVKTFNWAYDIKGRVKRRTVGLMRYKDELPANA